MCAAENSSDHLERSAVRRSTRLVDPSKEAASRPAKQARRVLHFSDGVLEEYSTDEDEEETSSGKEVVNTKSMNWPEYLYFLASISGVKFMKACDFLGGNFAWFLGITSPKYQYEIDEYERMQKQKALDLEMNIPVTIGDSSAVSQSDVKVEVKKGAENLAFESDDT